MQNVLDADEVLPAPPAFLNRALEHLPPACGEPVFVSFKRRHTLLPLLFRIRYLQVPAYFAREKIVDLPVSGN
jgi:hypothetical protein